MLHLTTCTLKLCKSAGRKQATHLIRKATLIYCLHRAPDYPYLPENHGEQLITEITLRLSALSSVNEGEKTMFFCMIINLLRSQLTVFSMNGGNKACRFAWKEMHYAATLWSNYHMMTLIFKAFVTAHLPNHPCMCEYVSSSARASNITLFLSLL